MLDFYKQFEMQKNKIFLTATDTTIGFVSQDSQRLNLIKQRPPNKKFIRAVNSLETLVGFTRVPTIHKKRVRRATRSTFVIQNESFRVIKDPHHLLLLDRLKWAYTTSANLSNEDYDEEFARSVADIVVYPLQSYADPSRIYSLGNKNIKRIR